MRIITKTTDRFCVSSAIDTCAIWHLISSQTLHLAACRSGCNFVISRYVEYECLDKPRKPKPEHQELIRRLRVEKASGNYMTVNMSIEDLQEVARLEKARPLGKGELSSIAIAKKLYIGMTTDDRKAFALAQQEMINATDVQTIPQLLGWLVFNGDLLDSDVRRIIAEHSMMGESHGDHFMELYEEGMRCRLYARLGS